jgi:hypothetical protein
MAFSIHLLRLECLGAQEVDGDETYMKVNSVVTWRSAPDKMHHVPEFDNHVAEYDFVEGRKRSHNGWVAMTPFDASAFVLRDCQGTVTVEIWDADTLTGDDSFGATPIDSTQAAGGEISVMFQRDGANYRLTYRVE